ncbi:hypothetical protein BGX38DRAFT_1205211, partial [Terfezia claveryi]
LAHRPCFLLPTLVISQLAGLCGLKHAYADLSHQRAPICLPTNHTYFPATSTNNISRAPASVEGQVGSAEVRTPPVPSRDIFQLYAQT